MKEYLEPNGDPLYYRFVVNGVGIYQAVEQDCPRNDARRLNKPEGSWLPRVGLNFPGAVSFWTKYGLRRYMASGLQAWHCDVVEGTVLVVTAGQPERILYADEFQIICLPPEVVLQGSIPLDLFLGSIDT